MAKITINKRASWDDCGRKLSGVIKQIFADYVLIEAETGNYIVRKSSITVSPGHEGLRLLGKNIDAKKNNA